MMAEAGMGRRRGRQGKRGTFAMAIKTKGDGVSWFYELCNFYNEYTGEPNLVLVSIYLNIGAIWYKTEWKRGKKKKENES